MRQTTTVLQMSAANLILLVEHQLEDETSYNPKSAMAGAETVVGDIPVVNPRGEDKRGENSSTEVKK